MVSKAAGRTAKLENGIHISNDASKYGIEPRLQTLLSSLNLNPAARSLEIIVQNVFYMFRTVLGRPPEIR